MARISGLQDDEGKLASLGKAIRARRHEMKLSQEALADAAGIDRSHMGKIERGERNVTLLNVFRVADALKITTAELVLKAGL
ncbi:helix-turn-helix transcriptional regulator [Brevundimonas sp.]|uniref:helix-turn-helix domain-containing protein n=1 Tax=Brevundimonas sp. TaxID=1871086 RepID=UPI0028A1BED2|nr:helix-turn-helix transcriptional regulator [Brevundimonas sp.]